MDIVKRLAPFALAFTAALFVYFHFHHVLPGPGRNLAAGPQIAVRPRSQTAATELDSPEPAATVVGPLANYARHEDETSASADNAAPAPASSDTGSASPFDRVVPAEIGPGGEVLQKNFVMTGNAAFSFDVPAHSIHPRLVGSYRATIVNSGAPVKLDFLVLNADQYTAFAHGAAGDALFSAAASSGEKVDLALPITNGAAARYYAVFSAGAKTKKIVNASLRLEL